MRLLLPSFLHSSAYTIKGFTHVRALQIIVTKFSCFTFRNLPESSKRGVSLSVVMTQKRAGMSNVSITSPTFTWSHNYE